MQNVIKQASEALRNFPLIGISALNQVLASGKNFILTLYLVRVLEPEQFGYYGIGFAVVLLYAGIGNALLLTQMVVQMPDKCDANRPSYCTNMLALCCLFMFITLLVALFAGPLVEIWWVPESGAKDFIFAVAVAGVATLATNFFVRLAYSTFREIHALYVHLVSVIVLLALLVTTHLLDNLNTATNALWMYALAHIGGAAIGLVNSTLPLGSIRLGAMRSAFRQSFKGGKWAVGGVGVTWMQSQSYLYITTIFNGAAGVATLNAGRILISPFTFILPAFTQLLLPRLAHMRQKKIRLLIQTGQLYALGLVIFGAIYLGILVIFGHWMISLIVGPKYEIGELYWISLAWGLVLLFQLCRTAASLVLQATHRFKSLTVKNSVTALVTVLASLALTPAFGLIGTLSAVGIGEALLALLLWIDIRRHIST